MIIPYDFDNVNTKRLNFVIRKSVFSLYNLRRIMYISYRKPILRTFFNAKGASMKKIHLINGTHWDREWRHTAEQSKLRLVDLMDNIINLLETKPQYTYFCVDGGTIVIEDYLSIRPENKQRIIDLVKAGRMFIVNWYTLPETNTVAPESLVRNLLLGHKTAKEYGGGMKSGYTATSYGQPSQLPQLYNGFGITDAIFYRGTNKHVLTPLFIWEGADGSKLDTLRTFDEVTRTNWFFYVHGPVVLGKGEKDLSYTYDKSQLPVHMADMKSYEKAFTLLHEDFDYIHDEKVQKKALDNLLKQAEPYAIGEHILALNMEDNDEPYRYLPELVADMNKIYPDVEIEQDNLDDYMAAIKSVKDYKKAVHHGELRYTTMEYNNFNALLGATHSSRIKIKLLNDDCENNLINVAEPLASYASAYGKEYPRMNLNRAWESLLKCHAHDSICGAAVDRAHEDMLYNFSLAKTVAEECTNRSVIALFGNIDTKAHFAENDHTMTFFNTLPLKRKEVIEVVFDTPKNGGKAVDIGVGGAAQGGDFYDIIDEKGNKVPFVELSRDDISIGVEREMDTKAIKFNANRKHVLVEVDLPQNGYRTYALRFRGPEFAFHPEIIDNRALIARDNGVLENQFIKVEINSDGTFDMTDKTTGRIMKKMLFYTDNGEVGSAHISALPKRNATYTSLGGNAKITMLEGNELRGRYRIEISMTLPAAATIDGEDRTREIKSLPITTELTLEKGSKFLKVHTTLVNEIRDHKLVANFPSGITAADWVDSESAWDVAHRTIKWRDHKDNFEGFVPFQPMQNFVDVSDGKNGLAILTKGLREYEIADDADRTVKITLIRTQRAYMTANSKMTVKELDKYTGQHSFGKLEYEYAIYPHCGNWKDANVLSAAYEHKVPVKAVQGVVLSGNLPDTASFFKINRENEVFISAVKQAEDGNGIIVRLWNATDKSFVTTVDVALPVKKITRVRMDETYVDDTNYDGKKFSFKNGAHKIETFRFEF